MYKLLIADDEAVERQALRFFVENSVLEIDEIYESATGNTTLQTAFTKTPDIILLDIRMPGLGGLEVMEQIHASLKGCQVIFSTAYNYFDYAVKALQLGAIDFLVKPIRKDTLLRVLNKAIDQLDAEREQEMSNARLEGMTHLMRKRLLTDLIRGNVDGQANYLLDMLEIGGAGCGNAFFILIQDALETQRKQRTLTVIQEDLRRAGYTCLAELANQCIILVVFAADAQAMDGLQPTVNTVLRSVFRDLRTGYIIGEGIAFDEPMKIETSIEYARAAIGDVEPPDVLEFSLLPERRREREPGAAGNVQAVCAYIDSNYDRRITLDDIAREVGYSKYHLSRLFKSIKQMTVIDYLTQVRLSRAKQLLHSGEYSIKQISRMVGYSDPNYFTWAFKKTEGLSPVRYRYAMTGKDWDRNE